MEVTKMSQYEEEMQVINNLLPQKKNGHLTQTNYKWAQPEIKLEALLEG